MTKSLSSSLLLAALVVGIAAPRPANAQSSFELLSAEMQAKVDGTFGDGTWNATAFTRALATKAQIAKTVESVVNGQKLAVSVDLPGQSVPVPGVTLRTPKLNDDNCQANLP